MCKKPLLTVKWAAALLLPLFCAAAFAQDDAVKPGPADPTADIGWPRLYKSQGHEVVMHEPQVDRWEKYERIYFRAAIVIRSEGATDSVVSATTRVDPDARTVFVSPRKIQRTRRKGLKVQ